jgi:GntR family transcriptional regulator
MSNMSVSQRLHEQLTRIIAETQPGERLLSEPALAEQLGVSRATLREAMRAFETEGIIRRRQGSGTYVNRPPHVIDSGLEVLESIEAMSARIGLSVTQGALNVQRRAALEDECKALSLNPCIDVTSISRVILTEGRAVAYLVDVLPVDILAPEDLGEGFNGSVLDLLLRRGDPPLYISRTEISAVQATPAVARSLGIQRGDVLLCFIADLYANNGKVVDHSYSYFLPGYFRFHVVRRVEQR